MFLGRGVSELVFIGAPVRPPDHGRRDRGFALPGSFYPVSGAGESYGGARGGERGKDLLCPGMSNHDNDEKNTRRCGTLKAFDSSQ